MLKVNSIPYITVTDFLKNNNITVDILINLWLLYCLAENKKKQSTDDRTPISYYLINCFSKYDCNNRNVSLIFEKLQNYEVIGYLINLYSSETKTYSKDYNKMIKGLLII